MDNWSWIDDKYSFNMKILIELSYDVVTITNEM